MKNTRPDLLIAALVSAATGCGSDGSSQATDLVQGPTAAECGGRGHLHGDHCHCDAGYEAPDYDVTTCVPSPAATGERLVVADASAKRLYVFEVGTWAMTGDFSGVEVNDHAGFLPLGDGRLAFHDSGSAELRIAEIASVDRPTLGKAVSVRGQVAHIATDPERRYLATSAPSEHQGEGVLTLLDLRTMTKTEVTVSTGEPGVALGGDPLALYHRNDSPPQFEMYAVADLLAGGMTPLDVAPIGDGPHGEVIAHSSGKLVSAAEDGMRVVPISGAGFGDAVRVPYAIDGEPVGRAFYARISGSGRFIHSYLRDSGPEGTPWQNWENQAYVLDLEGNTARTVAIGRGLVYRLAVCERLAAFTRYHPDGDFVHLLGASDHFQEFIGEVPLERMTETPAPDADVWSSVAFRVTALSTDCRYAFVTHGGDGKISVIDTAAAKVVHTLVVPTRLDHGGYLVSVRAGVPAVDTIGR